MKKHVFGRHFKRDANERAALFKNLLTSLVLNERIKTTQEKAKAIQSKAEKLVTKAKKGGDSAKRRLEPDINHDAVTKLLTDIAPRFANRQGGYTRIIKIGRRIADNAHMVVMEWTEQSTALLVRAVDAPEQKKSKKQSEKEEVEATIEARTKAKSGAKKNTKKSATAKKQMQVKKTVKGAKKDK